MKATAYLECKFTRVTLLKEKVKINHLSNYDIQHKLPYMILHCAQANASSGVAVHDDCKLKFNELQSKRMHRFITFMMDTKGKEIVVDKIGDRATSYDDFTSSLPEGDCRFAIYDFDFVTAEDVPKSRIFYILWSPDNAKVRSKMLYASSNEKFKKELNGIQLELQATDASEISLDALKDRVR
ncbi:hypothetical protein ABZP36_020098 [Zizania latifolia]